MPAGIHAPGGLFLRKGIEMDFDPIAYINTPHWQASRLGLERIRELLERLGRPQDRLKFVHVAGTNGKGSICAYLASILSAAGHRTGMFTSPYIERFEERIRVDGAMISPDELRDVTLAVREHAEAMAEETGDHPTEFELMTAVALEHFARCGCDIVVLEVGLGGRLDSTNVIDAPEACVIARIGLDHTALLGNTLAAIACEKAGIIKEGSAVVSWPQEPEAMAVIEHAAAEHGCELRMPDFAQLEEGAIRWEDGAPPFRPFSYKEWADLRTGILGSYQPQNATVALEAVDVLRGRGWRIPDEAVRVGVARTRWQGRFEIVEGGPRPTGSRSSWMAGTIRRVPAPSPTRLPRCSRVASRCSSSASWKTRIIRACWRTCSRWAARSCA